MRRRERVRPYLHHLAVDGRRDAGAQLQRTQRLTLVAAILIVVPAVLLDLMRFLLPLTIVGATLVGCLHHFQTHLALNVPLCPACHRRWQNGTWARAVGLTGIVAGAVAVSMGKPLGVVLILIAVALIAAARIARRILGGWMLTTVGASCSSASPPRPPRRSRLGTSAAAPARRPRWAPPWRRPRGARFHDRTRELLREEVGDGLHARNRDLAAGAMCLSGLVTLALRVAGL